MTLHFVRLPQTGIISSHIARLGEFFFFLFHAESLSAYTISATQIKKALVLRLRAEHTTIRFPKTKYIEHERNAKMVADLIVYP